MRKLKILDLFCGAGGCAVGYSRAGFDVVGVDLEPMRDYPFDFVQGDALAYVADNWHNFDAIHASPPCQAYSEMQKIWKNKTEHPDLIVPTRAALLATGLPFVIENVVGAPLRADLLLCGTMFGLRIVRHRIFECSFPINFMLPPCNHSDVYDPWHGKGRTAKQFREVMGINWMRDGGGGKRKGTLALAVPPAYTECIGKQLRAHIVCAECAPEEHFGSAIYNSQQPLYAKNEVDF